MWYVQDILVVQARCYIMCEEVSVKPFSNHWKPNTKNVLKGNRALWSLFSSQSSDYGATTVAKVSLYFTCMRSTVSFGSV